MVIDNDKASFSLPGACSIFSAEAYALSAAISGVNDNDTVIVLTDSASCLDALSGGRSKHPWIQAVERAINGRKISFSWIPGHAGIAGNEEADRLANEGRKGNPQDIPIPSQDAICNIKQKIWSVWERVWHMTPSHLRQIKASPSKYVDRKCASEQRILTRLRIGHTRLTHSHLIDRSSPPVCCFCGVQLTIQHILVDCRGYEQERKNCNVRGSISEILANEPEKEKAVLSFIKQANLMELL